MSTATLPSGWRDRLVPLATPGTEPGSALCLEPHDLVISKLIAFREKDCEFAAALLRAGLVQAETLRARISLVDAPPTILERVREWVTANRTRS